VLKTAEINGKPYRSASHYLKQRFGQVELGFHSVVFNPSDHDLVRGSPSERRAFLDRVLSAERMEYFQWIQSYGKTLEQRNAALKLNAFDAALLEGFTEPLVKLGSQIALARLQWLRDAQKPFSAHVRQIAPNQAETRLFYLSNWVPKTEGLSFPIQDLDLHQFAGLSPLPSLELLEIAFRKALALVEKAEQKAQHSLVGPHRDDWDISLGERSIRGHGSQGEVRSSLLALKMTEIERFREATGHRPLFLLDDFSSELDQSRREFLLRFLAGTDLQVFVTTTEGSMDHGRRFWVSQGNVLESSPA
jgi:DNA replication and repair protein RecF